MSSFRDRLRASARPGRPVDDTAIESLLPTVEVDDESDPDRGEAAPTDGRTARPRSELSSLRRRHARASADLAGLLLEMARRERFNHDLLERRAHDALAIERQIAALAGAAGDATDEAEEPSGERVAGHVVRHCPRCTAEQPPDANFCPYCGASRGTGG